MTVTRPALGIEDKGSGQGTGPPGARGGGTGIDQQREAQRHAVHEGAHGLGRFADVHGEHDERFLLERICERLQARHLGPTGSAPAGPEIHQHHLATVIREPVARAVQRIEFEGGQAFATPRLQRLGRGNERCGQQEKDQEEAHGGVPNTTRADAVRAGP